jgi:hypothetical protein
VEDLDHALVHLDRGRSALAHHREAGADHLDAHVAGLHHQGWLVLVVGNAAIDAARLQHHQHLVVRAALHRHGRLRGHADGRAADRQRGRGLVGDDARGLRQPAIGAASQHQQQRRGCGQPHADAEEGPPPALQPVRRRRRGGLQPGVAV